MVRFGKGLFLLLAFFSFAGSALAQQNTYDLRKLTQQQWLSMTTEERLTALSTSFSQAENQTFVGRFNENGDELYKRWGYDYYEMNDSYQNYSFRRPDNYNILNERRHRWSYNMFGDRIPYVRNTFYVWQESYFKLGTSSITSSDSILTAEGSANSKANYLNAIATDGVDGVWLVKETTDDWGASAVFAGALRNSYTPLTMQLPNIPGLRIDFQSANNSASVVSAVMLGLSGRTEVGYWPTGGVMLRGGRFQRKLGALTLGATYANQYVAQGNRIGHDSWYGTLTTNTYAPVYLAVRVLDDSPNDGEGGPTVRDVRLKLNGKYRDDIQPVAIVDDVTRDQTTLIENQSYTGYLSPQSKAGVDAPEFDLLVNERIPKFADYLYYLSYMRGQNSALMTAVTDQKTTTFTNFEKAKEYYQIVDPKSPVEVNGTQYVTYLFDIGSITEKVYRAEAEMTVDNDYKVQTSYIYDVTGSGYDTGGKPIEKHYARYWKTEAQADGNIKDHSNVTKIAVRFGAQVASILYGADANFNYRGFKISGEFVTNSNHYMYPDEVPGTGSAATIVDGLASRKGFRYSDHDNAYYIVSQKDWNRFGFSGEYFNMGKFYRPYLDTYYNKTTGSPTMGEINARNNTIRMPFVEDNDDKDQYPDTMNVSRVMGYSVYSNVDPDGVFPGNDSDHDGISDNNKNSNDFPDYNEPFMMFDADPDQFVFGNDFNNNTIPDFREDDNKMDTPYDLDRRGHHVSFRFTPVPNVNLSVGSMRTHGIGSDNRTNTSYLKANLNYNVFDVGKLYAEYRHESIQDNIQDDYVQVSTKMRSSSDYFNEGLGFTTSRFGRTYCVDEMEYKNSSVDRFFLESNIRAIPAITLENSVKMERNHQINGVTYENLYQVGQNINTLAMVNKVSFSKSFGNWQFNPGIKFRLYKKDFDEKLRSNEYYLTQIPVVTLKYMISSRTDVTFGMQGIPGFPFRYTDFVANKNDYERKTYILQLGNRTTYMGYQVWGGTGFEFDQMQYVKEDRNFENYKSTTTFVRVYLGY